LERGPARSCGKSRTFFDAFSTVEVLLLWFESIHPAILINQILAVNIDMTVLILQLSSLSNKLSPIKDTLLHLEEKTSDALQLLSEDAIKSISTPISSSDGALDSFTYTPETTQTGEGVCTLIDDVEILQSRTTSLLSKLNGDEVLVHTIMEAPEG
jgi:Rab3 GTPase-activating protein catalytic subunit